MSVLVIAEHDNQSLKAATLNTVTAAARLGEVVLLVAGGACRPAAEAAAKVAGVAKVLLADDALYAHGLAENLAPLVVGLAKGYSHVLAPATTQGKNVLPRVAALLDVAQISDIVEVIGPDTFVRPVYAGNALATVQSADAVKVMTVRGTAFEPAAAAGGSAAIETLAAVAGPGLSEFVGQELTKSDRPELTSASRIVSGGRGMGSGENFKLI
jgi:electron transfer flavoprotein alpha subunit